MDISIVIPLYNEEESLNELYNRLSQVLDGLGKTYEIIFIDDGSTDSSYEILGQLYDQTYNVKIYQFRKNYGKSAALSHGFSMARGEIVITMDADLQDDPKEIPALISKIESGYDLVSGWKKKRYDPFIKKHSSKLFNWTTRVVSGLHIHDMNCGLKAYRKSVIKSVSIYGQLHRFIPMLAHWQGFNVGELEVQHHPRKYGKTKFGPSRFAAGIFDLLTITFLNRFNKRPLHLFGSIGLLNLLAGSAISIYLAFYWIFIKSSLSNRPILFLGILLIIVGVQFISIGLLGEMITKSSHPEIEYSIKNSLE
ncbi:MAG: glycosyltransferase family 2 protein [candidate division KSB1 bacterium]|nr:glycosyltransferase family 2 protein [candidate division KSB1 bacterium]